MDSPEAMAALMKIEGFRSLNADIEFIINKSEAVKKAKENSENAHAKGKEGARRTRRRNSSLNANKYRKS